MIAKSSRTFVWSSTVQGSGYRVCTSGPTIDRQPDWQLGSPYGGQIIIWYPQENSTIASSKATSYQPTATSCRVWILNSFFPGLLVNVNLYILHTLQAILLVSLSIVWCAWCDIWQRVSASGLGTRTYFWLERYCWPMMKISSTAF